MDDKTTVRQAIEFGMTQLEGHSESAKQDVEVLLCEVLNCTRTRLFTADKDVLSATEITTFSDFISQRQTGKPVSYIIGHQDFWSLSLEVNDSTLIPRPETEILVEQVLTLECSGEVKFLDLGTGTGAIALAIAKERPNWQITGCDRIPDAIKLAQKNQHKNKLDNARFVVSNWFEGFENEHFDIIASNPPYVESDSEYLKMGDLRFEPLSALTSGEDGLQDIRLIISQSLNYLKPDGWLLFEHGFEQGEAVRHLLQQSNFKSIRTIKDYAGLNRITLGQN